jgi:small GTP-binding protein
VIAPQLDDVRQALLDEERRVLSELRANVDSLELDDSDRHALEVTGDQLDQPFLIVVVGEFNAGKSAFINALLGISALEEGVTPTTARIALLRYGGESSRRPRSGGFDVVTAPAGLLHTVAIVDTPGTNAVLREHEALTRQFVPRADLVLFLTSADRPYTETERAFLETINDWGKPVLLLVNKADLVETAEDLARIVEFVRAQAGKTLGREPETYALSSRRALRARLADDPEALAASGFAALEARVTTTLDEATRFRLKLLNPLGVARRVLTRAAVVAKQRSRLLDDDVATLDRVERDVAERRRDLDDDFRFRLSDIEKLLLDFARRGDAFFDVHLRLSRFRELLNRRALSGEFERRVVGDLPQQIEARLHALIDWLVERDLAHWQAVMVTLRARPAIHSARLVGSVDERFALDRRRLLDAVVREAQRTVSSYDPKAEADLLAQRVRDALAGTALLQVSALGLGATVAALATTTAADVTGLLAAGTLSIVGLLVLPARRRRARRELNATVAALRERLTSSLEASFTREVDAGAERIRAAVGPYSRFVRSERTLLDEVQERMRQLSLAIDTLIERIEALP